MMVLTAVTERRCVCSVDPAEAHGHCCQAGWAFVCLSLKEAYLHWPVTVGKVINDGQRLLESWTATECDICYQLAHSNNDLLGKTEGLFFHLLTNMNRCMCYPTWGFQTRGQEINDAISKSQGGCLGCARMFILLFLFFSLFLLGHRWELGFQLCAMKELLACCSIIY